MPGEPDPLHVRARAALLDATDALAEQLDALVLVGAQAIYLHTGDADLAVAECTTDADFTIGPAQLDDPAWRSRADAEAIAANLDDAHTVLEAVNLRRRQTRVCCGWVTGEAGHGGGRQRP
ncbi:MAG: hypothetical protein GY929_01840 [Actinomycetia bacterium]|nr:hypothetical protein [Actinomycetes bacterium]